MPYITFHIKPTYKQISFDDIINGLNGRSYVDTTDCRNTRDTRTVYREKTPEKLISKFDINAMIRSIEDYNTKYNDLINVENKATLYHSFKIPKRSGGLRQINAPKEELMTALRDFKFLIENKLFASYHTSAFAYIKGRSTIDAVKRHQANNSRWFLKLDFHDFFGSSTPDFVIKQLSMIFPFNEIVSTERGKKALSDALSLCFLNNGLPQGTPVSPVLTNLFMIPIDHYIAKTVRNMTPHLIYTRYADDIILSSDISFDWTNVQNTLVEIIKKFNAPFNLNTKKTRYGSSAGRNWNLGVMLNGNNEITIGHAKKKTFKAMLFSFANDYKNKIFWDIDDAQHLLGLISYYKMVEGKTIERIITFYNEKLNINIENALKSIIKNEI